MAKILSRLFNMNHYSKFIPKCLIITHVNGPKFSTTSNTNTLLFEPLSNCHNSNIVSLLTYPDTDTEVVENIDLSCFTEYSRRLNICGHSHGIVCLVNRFIDNDILLCNLVTREFRKLPPPIGDQKFSERAFGYDRKSNDFKVVKISEGIEIYNLSTDRWREIKKPAFDFDLWSSFSFEMHHNGVCYWWAYSGGNRFLISFDISEEVFYRISLPERFMLNNREHKILGVWNGSTVLFHYPTHIDEKHIDVWTLEKNEYGEILLSKLLTIGPVSGIQNTVMFMNSDEVVMVDKDGQVISYNINTKEVKNLPLKGEPAGAGGFFSPHDILRGFIYEKSLMSVKGGSRFDL